MTGAALSSELERELSLPGVELPAKVEELLAERKELSRELEQFKADQRESGMDDMLGAAEELSRRGQGVGESQRGSGHGCSQGSR